MLPSSARAAAAVALAVAVLGAAGCGGSGGNSTTGTSRAATPPAATTPTPAPGGIDPQILPPTRVPTVETGPADTEARRVINAWLRDLRHGRLQRAASHFAIPSVFQNGTPVLHLDNATEVFAVVASFPCGAVATHYGSAGGFTLVRFKLVERTGGDCHGATGSTTGGAIRVSGGKIREWYRLYDPEESGPSGPLSKS